MRRVFYGYCSQGPDGDKYTVTVQDVDIQKDFERGDLLVVHFAQDQGAEEPQLATSLYDTEQDTVISTDEGKFIKTVDVEITGIDKAWESGEAVIFVYTKQGDSETYYWQLVDSAPATTEVYGVTKLFDIANLNDVLNNDRTHDNEALTPAALKKFFDQLAGKDTDEEGETTPVQSAIKLKWIPKTDSQYILGQLSLDDGQSSIDINFPFVEEVQAAVQNLIPQIENKTHTGQLTNNGNGGGTGHETDASEPFITKMVPENLYFGQGKGLANDGEENPKLALSSSGIQISAPLTVSSPATISNTLTTTGQISAGSAKIVTSGEINGGTVKGGTIYEGGVSLINKYSKKLEVFSINTGDFNIPGNKSSGHKTKSIAKSGYRALGCVGYNVNDKAGRSPAHFDPNYANVWECYLTDSNTLQYCVYNMSSSLITVNMTVYILYVTV